MAPAWAATAPASPATAMSAGSATVVPKPKQKAKPSNATKLPLRAKAWADRLAQRKQAAFQPLDEERQANHDAKQAAEHLHQVRKRLLQHHDLEERDHRDDGRQVAHRGAETPCRDVEGGHHGRCGGGMVRQPSLKWLKSLQNMDCRCTSPGSRG